MLIPSGFLEDEDDDEDEKDTSSYLRLRFSSLVGTKSIER